MQPTEQDKAVMFLLELQRREHEQQNLGWWVIGIIALAVLLVR